MSTARLTILGAGSALPTRYNFPSSQLLELREKQYLIDCGEGTQIRMRQMGLKTKRLNRIFISHLHGDHCFGLIGLISSFALLNRTADLYIHGPKGITELYANQMEFFCNQMPYTVRFVEHDAAQFQKIHEDRSIEIYTIPLKHRVPACGFLFKEKAKDRHIKREMIDYHKVPFSQINLIKQGADFINEEGKLIANKLLTTEPAKTISYAYCSDTIYTETITPWLTGVDLLYHEATFADSEAARAKTTMHSTAKQAASIAKQANVKQLVIGHLSSRYSSNQNIVLQEAKSVFENTILAEDKMVIEF